MGFGGAVDLPMRRKRSTAFSLVKAYACNLREAQPVPDGIPRVFSYDSHRAS
jgi:hypothetical protein